MNEIESAQITTYLLLCLDFDKSSVTLSLLFRLPDCCFVRDPEVLSWLHYDLSCAFWKSGNSLNGWPQWMVQIHVLRSVTSEVIGHLAFIMIHSFIHSSMLCGDLSNFDFLCLPKFYMGSNIWKELGLDILMYQWMYKWFKSFTSIVCPWSFVWNTYANSTWIQCEEVIVTLLLWSPFCLKMVIVHLLVWWPSWVYKNLPWWI